MREDDQLEYKSALKRAASLCSNQELCTGQIREKLVSWNITDEDAERIIALLQKEKFLDDNRYATVFVRDKFRFNEWGKIKLAVMLRQKGIPEPVIQDALEQIDPALYEETCARIISEKSATLREPHPFKRKGKLFRFAMQRGFESDLIHRVLKMGNPG
jgi:regulatory protein